MKRKKPALGVLAGIRQDVKDAALASTTEYSAAPQGVGAAWTHGFLNQKPWHPLNFRNQAKVYEAETQAAKEAKDRAVAKAEFEAEQEFLHTLSYLSKEEQKKHQERQSVSWMYQKPAGMDAANSKVEQSTSTPVPPAQATEGSGEPPSAQSRPDSRRGAGAKGYVTNVLAAVTALANDERLQIKHVSGSGRRSPPRGGFDPQAQNQQFVVALDGEEEEEGEGDEDEERAGGEAVMRKRSKQSKKEKLREAEEVLRRAGILPAPAPASKSKKKHKKKDKEKKSGKSKDKDSGRGDK